MVFNQIDNTTPQNKDTGVVFVQKMFLINLQWFLVGTRTLESLAKLFKIVLRKYRWPEHYFSALPSGNSQKLLKTNQFLVSDIFFAIMNISFFSLGFDLFSINAKEVNQTRNNVVYSVASLVFLFCCALTTGRCNAFQHNFEN